jgi:parallel beta-helix repeat protein
VVLAGDHVQWRDGFFLEDVSGVLLRGFTIRDFGIPRTPRQSGVGQSIFLRRAHNNIIQYNVMTNSNMMGITMNDSATNTIEDNVVYTNDPMMNGCGIHIDGSGSKDNVVRHNTFYDNPLAGIMLNNAGTGNVIVENNCSSGRRFGVTNINTNGTRIEGNRSNYNVGFDEATDILTSIPRPGIGIDVRGSTGVTVRDNDAENNATLDIRWDGQGENTFQNNKGTAKVFRLTASPNTIAPGGQITVTWTASGGRPMTDWIGLYAVGAADTDANIIGRRDGWRYTGGVTSGSITFTAPTRTGRYEFRYFLEDGFTQVAWSNAVTVE